MPKEIENLILDGYEIVEFTKEDKAFLERFTNLQRLSLKHTKLSSLRNMPKIKLSAIDLSNNQLRGDDLVNLTKMYADDLVVLKLCSNKITNLEHVKSLAGIKNLLKLDLSGTRVADRMEFEDKVFSLLPTLQVINDYDREGEYIDDEFDQSDDYSLSEHGEDELEESDYEPTKFKPAGKKNGKPRNGDEKEGGQEECRDDEKERHE